MKDKHCVVVTEFLMPYFISYMRERNINLSSIVFIEDYKVKIIIDDENAETLVESFYEHQKETMQGVR